MAGTSRSRLLLWQPLMGGLLIAALLGGIAWLSVGMVSNYTQRHTEHQGTVGYSLLRCDVTIDRNTHIGQCVGDFRSDDGALTVRDVHVTISSSYPLRSEGTESVVLAGPGDTTADSVSTLTMYFYFMLTGVVVGVAWLIAQVVWLVREVRRRLVTDPEQESGRVGEPVA